MAKRKRVRVKRPGEHVTSLALPRSLWKAVRRMALEREVTVRKLIIEQLEQLTGKGKV